MSFYVAAPYDLVEEDIPEVVEKPPRRPALGDPPRETVRADEGGVAAPGA